MNQDIGLSEHRNENRFPCVQIALLYSAIDDDIESGLRELLYRAAIQDMSLSGLSFIVDQPRHIDDKLIILVAQDDTEKCEQLYTEVRWCKKIPEDRYQIGVKILDAHIKKEKICDSHNVELISSSPPVPDGLEVICPACRKQANFRFIGNQIVQKRSGLMPLYCCSECNTTRSIIGLFAHARNPEGFC